MPGLHALQKILMAHAHRGGDTIEVDVGAGETRNLTAGETLRRPPLAPFPRGMVELGGEKPYIKARLARMHTEAQS